MEFNKDIILKKKIDTLEHGSNRTKLPEVRYGLTKRVDACGLTYYLTVNFIKNKPMELFITVAKEGSAISGFVEAFAITISIALQYGVPWKVLYDKYLYQIFEPRDDVNSSLIHSIGVQMNAMIEMWNTPNVK
ncbi:hypothetical protein LCGC14_1006930 [marine sediment metagenome]|uniref:ribonucleoside-diphosphate reductase n=1 Tax=marine sediment metagenome TaxID=412755 RepID=A0A0F9N613_9ZZZZ